jgi:hypothetical protein
VEPDFKGINTPPMTPFGPFLAPTSSAHGKGKQTEDSIHRETEKLFIAEAIFLP